MKHYHYDRDTGEFIGSTNASLDPLETRAAGKDVYTRPPAHATSDAPPAAGEDQVAVYRDGSWSLVPDHRGHTYWLSDGSEHTISEIGIVPPAEAEPALPPAIELERAREAKRAEIRAAYAAAAVVPQLIDGVEYHSGFDSITRLDGARRLAEQLGAAEVVFWDTSNAGHTLPLSAADQVIHTLGQQVQALFAKKQQLMVDIDSADVSSLDAISW